MQTSGTVIYNGRMVNINGYDCFVNMSTDAYKYTSFLEHSVIPSSYESSIPFSIDISNTESKFGLGSVHSVNGWSYEYVPNITIPSDSVITASLWYKWGKISTMSSKYEQCGGTQVLYNMGYWFNYNGGIPNYYYMQDSPSGSWHSAIFTLDNNWHHWAYVRTGSKFYFFLDGAKKLELSTSAPIYMFDFGWRSIRCDAYIDDLVYIKGDALWTSDFTPPTTYLLDSKHTIDIGDIRRRNIAIANVDKKIIIPDDDSLKQY